MRRKQAKKRANKTRRKKRKHNASVATRCKKINLCQLTKSTGVKNIAPPSTAQTALVRKKILIGWVKKSLIIINFSFKIFIYHAASVGKISLRKGAVKLQLALDHRALAR